MPKKMRSLYQCENARVVAGERIRCKHGSISLPLRFLKEGRPLEMAICQLCSHFAYLGEPVKKIDRGWRD